MISISEGKLYGIKAKKKFQKSNSAHFELKSSKPAIANCENICRIFLLLCRKSSIRRFPTSRILAIRHLRFVFKACIHTLAKTETIYPKNVRTKVSMDFTQDKCLAPRTIEKNENPGSRFGATS
jgi:hypothetical protein